MLHLDGRIWEKWFGFGFQTQIYCLDYILIKLKNEAIFKLLSNLGIKRKEFEIMALIDSNSSVQILSKKGNLSIFKHLASFWN